MLLREDVIVATNANENADDERAVTEIPTQVADADNTHIYLNQQQSDDAGICSLESVGCISNSGIVNNLHSDDESVRRFPVMNEPYELSQSTFLKPVGNVMKMTFGITNRLEYVEIKRSPIMRRKCTDSLKVFPMIDGKRHTSTTFPCYTVRTTSIESETQEGKCAISQNAPIAQNTDETNTAEINFKKAPIRKIFFPLQNNNENISHPNKFPSSLKEIRANIMNANFLPNNKTKFSTHNLVPQTTTTTTTTMMTQSQVSNSDHARRIQVQYNEQQVLNTIENGPDFRTNINCCVYEQQQQELEEQQHINDAKLATAIMAKNTTMAPTTSSQNNDERIITVDISENSLSRESNQLSTHNLHSKNEQQNYLAQATPPLLSEILARILEEARDLLDAIGTINKQTFYADSQLHRPPTLATCSDVRDSSSQEVPLRDDGVSVKVVTTHTLPENKQEEYNLNLLPKFYALERYEDKLILPEVDQSIEIGSENNKVSIVNSNDEQQKANDDKENDKRKPEPERETNELDDVAMTLTQIEETGEEFVSESSVNEEDNSEQQKDEMKYEMKSVKSNLPETEAIRRHSYTYKNEPNINGPRSSNVVSAGTRTPLVDSKYAKVTDQPSALRGATTLNGGVPTGVAVPVRYAKANEQYNSSAARPASTLIDTKYGRSKDEPSAKRSTNAYVGQRTANLDTKYARANDEQSALRPATSLHGGVRKTSLVDTKCDRSKDETSATKFANSLYGGIQTAPSAAKLSNLSTHVATRAGYTAPLVDSKYGKNDETSATNRSNLLLAGGRSTNPSSLRDSTKYGGKHVEPSATNLSPILHGTIRSTNTSSLLDSKNYKTNDEPSATKLSTVSRADSTRNTSLLDSKYAKASDEFSALRHPHSATRLPDATPPLVDSKYARTYVEPIATSDIGRSVSVDDLSATLPKSTRLRRQRRMHSQNSQERAEDTIERLNRLRARISGALSEVKGVLKHYSTETETEPEVKAERESEDVVVNRSDGVAKVDESEETQQKPEENEGPVQFRFVKKIRRRSCFDENEEDKEKREEELAKTMAMEAEKINPEQTESVASVNLELPKPVFMEVDTTNEQQAATDLESKSEELSVSNENLESVVPELIVSKSTPDETISTDKKEEFNKIATLKDIQEKQSLEELTKSTDNDVDATADKKPKKKIIIRTGINRRASIAAVEGSKIEPPITPTLSLNIKTQRRPSDSEAIVKKKVTHKNTASDETASKVKIIHKVKRPSVKKTNAIPTDQNKTITSEAAAAPTATTNSENNNSSDINDQANFSSKDATTTTLATQLVIDDASLTIAATKDDSTSLATIGLEEENAVMVAAALLSPLLASEANSQAKEVAITEQLEKLVGETLTVGAVTNSARTSTTLENLIPKKILKIDETSYAPLELINAKIDERLKSAVEENITEETNVQVREGEKLIDQKVIPAVKKQERQTSVQQVFNDIAVPQEAFTFSSKTQDVTTNDLVKETTPLLPTPTSVESINVEATKAGNTETTINSAEATSPCDTSSATSAAAMPELQMKALQAFIKPLVPAPFNVTKDDCVKKKVVLKKLLRKNSTEKVQKVQNQQTVSEEQKNTINAATKDKSKKFTPAKDAAIVAEEKLTPTKTEKDDANDADWPGEVNEVSEELIEEEPAPEKKKRRIKKKVIIKRQPRKLSISDTFFKGPESEPSSPIEETLEKPIEYVKVGSDEEEDYEEIVQPAQPTKSCLKLREFQVGDHVMYAERYRKTQVRWKKGIVLERITSISYKLEVEGKEVPAHISYIKKFTDRKVNFSGKEYLEIDYEQIAEEEEKARRYSIWNMV